MQAIRAGQAKPPTAPSRVREVLKRYGKKLGLPLLAVLGTHAAAYKWWPKYRRAAQEQHKKKTASLARLGLTGRRALALAGSVPAAAAVGMGVKRGKEQKDRKARELSQELRRELAASLPKGYRVSGSTAKTPLWGLLGSKVDVSLRDDRGTNPLIEDDPKNPFARGTLDLTVHKKLLRPSFRIEADSLYLKPEHRKKGVGRAAVSSVIRAGRKASMRSVGLEADEQGKAVWSRIPGARFRNPAERRMLRGAYKRWQRRNGGPKLRSDAPPSAYPKRFLHQHKGMIGYSVPLEKSSGAGPDIKALKKGRRALTPEERAEVMKRGAVWHHAWKDGKQVPSPAVWKSVVNGKTWWATNTHRAGAVKDTLKGAINAFRFIKTTA